MSVLSTMIMAMDVIQLTPRMPPKYPFDRSIECRLSDFEGNPRLSLSGEVKALKASADSKGALFALSLIADDPEFTAPESIEIPRNVDRLKIELSKVNKFGTPITYYVEFSKVGAGNANWASALSNFAFPIAAGLCELHFIYDDRPNRDRGSDAELTQ
ncbi:MAG: hypothetical protein QNJ15_04530 [Erythrobacter sp.]|nr:hypothetical protein [Erythrobacter sp.]